MPINYIIGDATQPVYSGPAILVHVCNDLGKWGAGFVLAVSRRWPEPEAAYRAWHRGGGTYHLLSARCSLSRLRPTCGWRT